MTTSTPITSTTAVATVPRGRRLASYASVKDLGSWMRAQPDVTQVVVIRTSDQDKSGFAVMFDAGVAMLAHDPDVQVLTAIGARIVTDAGAPDRARVDAYEIRRGSVLGGVGYGLLGYALVIGSTLFILYLESARTADIPGPTADQTRNTFTEVLCTLLRHFRPTAAHTPLVSRLFRSMDFAHQVLRTLRELDIELYAEGAKLDLKGKDDLGPMLRAWFASREADAIVSRLGNIELSMYMSGAWYLSENFLPFTWRAATRIVRNALTGEEERIVEDKHRLEVVPESVPVLSELLHRVGQRSTTHHELGIYLGEQGVTSRAPRHFNKGVLLNSSPTTHLASNAARSLLQERWLTAWETGIYRRLIKMKSDPRTAMPALVDHIVEVTTDTGAVELYLEVNTPMPAPPGGWGLSPAVFATARARLAAEDASPQNAARRTSTGKQKPLNGLCSYTSHDDSYALTSVESGPTYELRCRPLIQSEDANGHQLGWVKSDTWLATIRAEDLHRSVGGAMARALTNLEGRTAALQLRPAATTAPAARTLELDTERAREAVDGASARLQGVKADRQRLEGARATRGLDDDETEQLDELAEDERDARAARRAAVAALERLQHTDVDAEPAAAAACTVDGLAEADVALVDVVAASLLRTRYRAPDILNQVLSRVLRDLRVTPDRHNTAVTWTATLVVPLLDGTDAEIDLHGDAPIPNRKGASKRAGKNEPAALNLPMLAEAYLRDGLELAAIGTRKGVRADGAPGSFLVKMVRAMLADQGGVSAGLVNAALDMPALVRPSLHQALTTEAHLDDPWLAHLRHVYTGTTSFGVTWCMGQHHEARLALRHIEQHAADPFDGMDSYQLSDAMPYRYELLRQLALKRQWGRTQGRGPWLQRRADYETAPGTIGAQECAHTDCAQRRSTGLGGILAPMATPETNSTIGRPHETLLGLVCRTCRRMPGLPDLVVPTVYLQDWVGGRRMQIGSGNGAQWVGTRLVTADPS